MLANKPKFFGCRQRIFVSKEVHLVLILTEDGLYQQDKTSGLCLSVTNIRCFQYIVALTQGGVLKFSITYPLEVIQAPNSPVLKNLDTVTCVTKLFILS